MITRTYKYKIFAKLVLAMKNTILFLLISIFMSSCNCSDCYNDSVKDLGEPLIEKGKVYKLEIQGIANNQSFICHISTKNGNYHVYTYEIAWNIRDSVKIKRYSNSDVYLDDIKVKCYKE